MISVALLHFNIHGGGLVTKSCPTLATPRTVDSQAPLPMGFPRQEYWSWLPFPSPRDLSDPGMEPKSPALQADSLCLPAKPVTVRQKQSKLAYGT